MVKIIQYMIGGGERFLRTIIFNKKVKILVNEIYKDTLIMNTIKYKEKYKKNIIYYKDDKHSYDIINFMNPKIILLTISPDKNLCDEIKKNINCEKIFYIPHGIFHYCPDDNIDYINGFNDWSKNISYIVGDKYAEHMMKKLELKYQKINGYPQFDKLLKNKYYNKKMNYDNILIINGSNDLYYETTNYLINLINMINVCFKERTLPSYTPDFKERTLPSYTPEKGCEKLQNIIIKNKKITKTYNHKDYNDLINLYNNVKILNIDDIIYPYLYNKLIIVIEGGTSYIESLLINNNVILYGDGLLLEKPKKYGLMASDDIIDIGFFIKNSYILSDMETYKENKKEYINSIIGGNIESSIHQILNIL
jgi:hypothetical protein